MHVMKLHGIFPPLTTPFNSDGSLALNRLKENIARYNRTQLAGYVVIGSTGESVLLESDEIDRVWDAARDAAAPEKILIAGTGTDSTDETIARTNRAAALGYKVALVKTPYYYKPQMTPNAIAEHFLRVADAARIPVLIYSVPQFTGVAVEAPVVARLAQHPNIIGIKESSGNVQRVTEIIQAAPSEFQTLVGSASTLYVSLTAGAVGGILGLSCVLPELCVELWELSRPGESDRALALQRRLLDASRVIIAELGVPGTKYAMERVGFYGGPARRPFLPLSDSQRASVDSLLSSLVPAISVFKA